MGGQPESPRKRKDADAEMLGLEMLEKRKTRRDESRMGQRRKRAKTGQRRCVCRTQAEPRAVGKLGI